VVVVGGGVVVVGGGVVVVGGGVVVVGGGVVVVGAGGGGVVVVVAADVVADGVVGVVVVVGVLGSLRWGTLMCQPLRRSRRLITGFDGVGAVRSVTLSAESAPALLTAAVHLAACKTTSRGGTIARSCVWPALTPRR
jgi:hypothetical protein